LLITSWHGPHRKHSSSVVALVSVASGTRLLSRCPETALVYAPTSWSLHSNGSTRYNTNTPEEPVTPIFRIEQYSPILKKEASGFSKNAGNFVLQFTTLRGQYHSYLLPQELKPHTSFTGQLFHNNNNNNNNNNK
jgi:hypothetical protein